MRTDNKRSVAHQFLAVCNRLEQIRVYNLVWESWLSAKFLDLQIHGLGMN